MPVKPPLQIGIIGCGAITELYYLPSLASLSNMAKVALLFDPDPRRTAKLSGLASGARCVNDFSEVGNCRLDLAIVASPPRFHAQQTIALLESGVAVLCEKPMAATVAEAEAMIEAAARTKGLLAVGLFRRFFPVSKTIRELIDSKPFGGVRRFDISEGGAFNWPAQSASFFQKTGSQGGVLADLGVHVLDLLIWWLGMPETIDYEDDAMGGLEANCLLKLTFANGVFGTVRLSRDTQLPNQTEIEFERGWVRCKAASADQLEIGFSGASHAMSGQLGSLGELGTRGHDPRPALTYHQSFSSQLKNAFAALHGEEPLFIPGEQGIASLRLIEQCYRQRKLMPMPWMSESETVRGNYAKNH